MSLLLTTTVADELRNLDSLLDFLPISSIMVSRADSLAERQYEILRRLDRLTGASADLRKLSVLKDRQERLLASISALEATAVHKAADAPKDHQCPPSEVQSRLTSVLVQDGVKNFRFVRAPADYYSQVSQPGHCKL